jgi:integrase
MINQTQALKRLDSMRQHNEEDPINILAIETLICTGMRSCELTRLSKDCLKTPGHITITSSTAAKRGKAHSIPVRKTLYNRLQSLFSSQPAFYPQHKEQTATRLLRSFWERIRVRVLGIDGCSLGLHQLRHAFASTMFERSDYNPATIQYLLGHNSLAYTSTYLTRLRATKLKPI